ncbi:MAG: secretin N-terminal domain-containing protein [Thermoanaerobaculia bacterium]|nr:secretin N-terminal domain-containing protein [Thermoanaerobaculia bacterium]
MKLPRTILVVAVALLVGCSGQDLKREARDAELMGDWDQAVILYLQLVQEEPTNLEHRNGLTRAKIAASQQHFERAKRYMDAGQLEPALVELQETVQLDPTNQYAQVELEKLREQVYAAREQRDIETSLETLKSAARGISAQPPILDPRSDEPIDLSFPEPVSVMDIYRALGKAFGINVLFDNNLRDQDISITLAQVTAEEALEMLMRAARHFYKVVDDRTILIAADTPQNRRAYEDLVIQTFFLSNSEVRDVMTMLRSLVGSRQIAAMERLNAIVLRDTADKVKVAEQLIATNDKSRAEVVVDVELIQVNSSKLRELGLSLQPGNQIGFTIDSETVSGLPQPEGGGSLVRFSDIEFIDSTSWILSLPSFLLDFVKETTDAQILAQPKLRISEGESARFVVADQVPIPVTSFNTANTIGGNIVPVTSFQYQDVGIILEIEPRVHHNNEISLDMSVEVSNITGNVGQQPIIGTRNVETTIRLKDGETNFLAGLIRADELRDETGIPGLSSIPIFGRLFTKKRTQVQSTDIVLTMTPHIIRRADITQADLLPIWVGTETNFTLRGGSPRVEGEPEGPFDEDDTGAASARQRLRQRLENLPRNVVPEQDEPEETEPDNSGTELAPATAPRRRRSDDLSQQEQPPPAPGLPAMAPDRVELFAAPPVAGGVEIRLVPTAAVVKPGSRFSVGVEIDAGAAVSHLPMTMEYDGGRLRLDRVEEGDFLGGSGEATILVDRSREGRIVVGASRLGRRAGVTGRGRLLTLHFEALAAGPARLRVSESKALDAGRAPLGVAARELRLDVVDSPPSPLRSERQEASP